MSSEFFVLHKIAGCVPFGSYLESRIEKKNTHKLHNVFRFVPINNSSHFSRSGAQNVRIRGKKSSIISDTLNKD